MNYLIKGIGRNFHPAITIGGRTHVVVVPNGRLYSASSAPKGQPSFVSKILDNLRQELSRNKDMKDNISKFREEAQKLEQSDALRQARRKFEAVEAEAKSQSEVLKEGIGAVKGKLDEGLKDLGQSDFAKKASEMGDQIGQQAQQVAGSVRDVGARIGSATPIKAISGVVQEELNQNDQFYRPPLKLRKRLETSDVINEQQIYEPNTEAMGIELHKDSRFYQSWEKFKDNNPYVNKMLDWKIKYDESDNGIIRASRLLTNKVSEMMGGLFQRTELSECLTEIMQIDPSFDKDQFLKACQVDIIPNILEAMCRGDFEVLQDWCYEAAFAVISQPLKQAQQQQLKVESKILDIANVDLVMGRVLEQGPVLVITFCAQMVQCVREMKTGKIVEGDPEKVLRVQHAWVMCRDPNELNPRAAWRVLELSASATEQLL